MNKLKQKISNFIFSPKIITKIFRPFLCFSNKNTNKKEKILIIRLDEIGDLILTTPLIRELREAKPNSEITLIVKKENYNLFEKSPYLKKVLVFRWSGFFNMLKFAKNNIWKEKFDLAIMPRWDTDLRHASLLIYLSGAKKRIGYAENINETKEKLNKDFNKFFTKTILDKKIRHEIEYNLNILKLLEITPKNDNLELWTDEEDKKNTESFLKQNNIKEKDILISLGIGSSQKNKEWPIEKFFDVVNWLKKNYQVKILIIGGQDNKEKESELMEKISAKNNGKQIISIVGKTTLRQTVSIMSHCKVHIGNDSGPMHIAATLKLPIIEISRYPIKNSQKGADFLERFHPWKVKYKTIQPLAPLSPCSDLCELSTEHCISQITTNQVKNSIEELFEEINIKKI